MRKATLQPTAEDTFRIVFDPASKGSSYEQAITRALTQEAEGDIQGACDTRYQAFQAMMDLFPEDMEIVLDWDDSTTQSAMLLISFSAIDHFLAADFEMCAAQLEMLLELDPEDHLEATKRLAYCYIALEEYELFDEIINDISDKYPEKDILKMWCDLRRQGQIAPGDLIHLRKNFPETFAEFTAPSHPVDEEYLYDIEQERPSRKTLARELWLQTEHLWTIFPDLPQALKTS